VTFRPDCISNTTFTVKDSDGNKVDPIDRIRTAYRIGDPGDDDTPRSDVITIAQGAFFTVSCELDGLFPPEADILVPGDYTVQATYNNYIQDPRPAGQRIDLWMGAIKSAKQTITIYRNYTFEGFFAPLPLANLTVKNKAKAGQAIPVKWRITDPTGAGISDPDSFGVGGVGGLSSYPIDCSTLSEIGTDVTTESAAGASGLQYMGDGNWQYNWKTPKTYANQCRTMVLKLNDGNTYTADFQFK
jgi:hypothetical protein